MERQADRGRLGLTAFGLGLITDVTPPGAWEERPLSEPILKLRSAPPSAIAQSWSGLDAIGWEGTIDGAPFVAERGQAGDYRFVHGAPPGSDGLPSKGTHALHHLSPDAGVLQCAPSDQTGGSWWRVVLDSVLFTVALARGYEALHAGAVATPDGVIAITATTGGGKSTLLTELLAHGLTLMADDVLVLEPRRAAAPSAHPAPPLMTVPAARMPTLQDAARSELPETIVSLGQERWIAMPVHPQPLPLMALVVLNRGRGLATSLRRAHKPLGMLVGSLLRFPRVRERERTRFELAGAIAEHVPIWKLDADLSVSPEILASLLLAELAESRQARTRRLATVVA